MARESRVKKTLLNARMNMICYFVVLIVSFFTRKIFLDKLGADFMGLTSTLGGFLSFLNLADLGVSNAVYFILFKLVANDDKKRINEVISLFGYLYYNIGVFILGAGILFSFFLPAIFANTPFSLVTIYVGFYVYLCSSLIGYFVNYRCCLLYINQRGYIVRGYFQLTSTTKVLIQLLFAIYVRSFVLYFVIELVFGIINAMILNRKNNHLYPWLTLRIRTGNKLFRQYPEMIRYAWRSYIHSSSWVITSQIIPILIYTYSSLSFVAFYNNYVQVVSRVSDFVSGILDSADTGIGILIAEGDSQRIYSIYKELFSVRFIVGGILALCIYHLASPFISVWLGTQYVLSPLLVSLISLSFFLDFINGTTVRYLNLFGLVNDLWTAIVNVLSLGIVLVAGSHWGLAGILAASLAVSFPVMHLWKPYYLFSRALKLPYIQYVRLICMNALPLVVALIIALFIKNHLRSVPLSYNWGSWLLEAFAFFVSLSIPALLLAWFISSDVRIFAKRLTVWKQHLQ
ncbi:MAG: sugar transporter [Prevotellaceae bacterium]|jgi:O-antigen/teichoic acid export membrane protein|nr:sugar transporter [Prevotellaceae bacterium]